MRRWIGLTAIGLGLAAAVHVEGQNTQQFIQSGQHASSLGGVSKPVVNVPINIGSTALSPFPRQNATGGFFSGFFRKVGKLGMPVVGQSNLPAPGSFPSTRYPNSFQPLPPVTK